MLYLDASALVPLYTPEADSEEMERIIMAAERVVVSDLTIAESKNAIIRKGRRQQARFDDVTMALRLIDEHVAAQRFLVVEMRRDFLMQVPALSQQAPVHLRTMDAVHLAAALACEATEMATYDHDLGTAARSHGLTVSSCLALWDNGFKKSMRCSYGIVQESWAATLFLEQCLSMISRDLMARGGQLRQGAIGNLAYRAREALRRGARWIVDRTVGLYRLDSPVVVF